MVDIYSLYQSETRIEHTTPDSKKLTLILNKPSIGVKEKVVRAMGLAKDEAEKELLDNAYALKLLGETVNSYAKTEKVDFILLNDKMQQEQSSDLFPIGDREAMSEEDIKKGEEEYLKSWAEKHAQSLALLNDEELFSKVKTILIESRSIMAASEAYTKHMLLYCVLDENHRRVFKNLDDVERLDEIVFQWLKKELDAFVAMLSQKEVRKAVQEKSFLAPTESARNTTDSTTT
jgi:hypothetical protein